MTDLRVGVVGAGIGQLHMLSWLDVRGAVVVAVADTDEAKRVTTGQDWGVTSFASLDELLDLGVDIVDLCTPPAGHEEQIIRCLDAGVHVICEKPLVDSVAAAERILAAERQALVSSGARLMPVFQYRFGRGAARARALVDEGLTGRLYTASSSTLWRREAPYFAVAPWRGTWAGERGGSVLSHAIHNHDLLTWIGGPLTEVRAMSATLVNDIETEDCAVAVARTCDGGLMTMNVTMGAVSESTRLVWCFENVTIESSTDPYNPAQEPWVFDFRSRTARLAAEEVWASVPSAPAQYTGQFEAFVEAVNSGGPSPVTTGDAAASLELVAAWYHSALTGSVETLPLAPDHPYHDSWLPTGSP